MATMADNEKWPCSVCKKPRVFLCSRCQHPYCSPKCQSDDFLEHKGNCFPMPSINRGYVSACINDIKAESHIEEMNEKISAYCKCTANSYRPHVNELCLAKFEDGEWYRAETLKVIDSKTFSVMFIDYGNRATMKSSDIRKMSEEFMHKCLMNVCFIKGAPEKPTDENIEKASTYFRENQVFSINSATKETDAYLIEIPELHW